MKRFISILLCALLLCSLMLTCGCRNQQSEIADTPTGATEIPTEATDAATEPTVVEPSVTVDDTTSDLLISEGSVLYGVDISGMTAEEAYAAVCESLAQYTLTLTVNGRVTTVTADDMSLSCAEEEVAAYLTALENGETPSQVPAITYNAAQLRGNVAAKVNVSATNATVKYNASADRFEISPESSGYNVDLDVIMESLIPAVEALGTSVTATVSTWEVLPTITKADSAVQNALASANSYLSVSLTYTYSPEGELVGTETIPVDTIGSFISFDSNVVPFINTTQINNYVTSMGEKYCGDNNSGQFKTTGGSYINITVSYSGAAIDTNAMVNDIKYCMENKISGTRVAPYLEAEVVEDMAFGGTYIEVNLSAQYIWMYKSGECIVSSPIVSGCVYYQNTTPTGLYSIRYKATNTYLVGATYSSYVQYWMPFLGGYGLHDASWRSSFGGDIYLYDGSHGCVNLPTGVAATIYANCTPGTKVILYGGATSTAPVTQEVTGTASYTVMSDSPAFALDAHTVYGTYDLTYTSSNPAVAEVATDGTVTVKSPGTTVITATFPGHKYYNAASLDITVTVQSVCGDSHTFSEWQTTTEPTCVAGEQVRTCGVCNLTETQELAPIQEHTFSEWTMTKEPTCAPGESSRTCSVCGLVETQTLDPIHEHSYGEWTTTTEPTCVAPGEQSQTCGTCGHVNTAPVPVTEHAFDNAYPFCGNGCGTANPGYVDPTPDPEPEPEPTPDPE